eukprot:TRINITY_DN3568_c2_g5_i1.p1 TRINITY_DN3568_c2_g5~~TRINITY_DN3568_c2_g5_i1.p1  ORF type:complete len:185 (+),score=19.28 TRINITY_DN3568_c2_g5_i1:59-613(+)
MTMETTVRAGEDFNGNSLDMTDSAGQRGKPLSAKATPFVPKVQSSEQNGNQWETVLKTVRGLVDVNQEVNQRKIVKMEEELQNLMEVSIHDSRALTYDIDLLESTVSFLTQKVAKLSEVRDQEHQHLFSELSSLSSSIEKDLGLSLHDDEETSNELLISFTHDSTSETGHSEKNDISFVFGHEN